jgi:hypothetical protein
MKRAYKADKSIALLSMLLVYLSGCASMQPLSNYARTGDTVAISLGGTDSNALVPILKKENITITISDASNNTYPVKLRNVFRIYGDPTNPYSLRSAYSSRQDIREAPVYPHQGQWMAIIDLVDPVSGQAPPLAVGSAYLAVSSPDIRNWVDYPGYNLAWTNGNLSQIPLQILSGTGSANPMNYMANINFHPLDSLDANPQVEVSVSGTPSKNIGGGAFTFRYVTGDFGSEGKPRAIAASPDPYVQLASHYLPQTDGTTLLNVMITNPHGFKTNNNKTGLGSGQSLFRSLRFSIAWDNGLTNTPITDGNWQNSLTLVNGVYVDVNGNTMTEIAPALAKIK